LIKQRSILPTICALALLANGPFALGQTAAGVASESPPPMPGAAAGQAIQQNPDSAQAESISKGSSPKDPAADSSGTAASKAQSAASDSSAASSDNNSVGTAKSNAAAKSTSAKSAGAKASKPSATAKPKGNYVSEEPIADPAGSPTRVHRPGTDSSLPTTAPAIGSNPASPMPLLPPPPTIPPKERFPSVGQLEQLMFGHTTPNLVVDNRLDKLESSIFQKTSPELDIEQRIKRLKDVIVGEREDGNARPPANAYSDPSRGAAYGDPSRTAFASPSTTFPIPRNLGMTLPELDREPTPAPFFPNYGHYDLNQQLSIPDAEKFALDVINEVRQQQGLGELYWDSQAYKVASEQVSDLVKRDAVSHQNSKGENPDLRYTRAGGSDSVVEGAIMFPSAEKLRPTRQLVVKMLETFNTRQDDKDALLYSHASGFSMAFQWSPDKRKLVCCTEVVTKHGQMENLPPEAVVGEKIEVKGSVAAPYKFQKITLAWEGLSNSPPDDSAESSEALPYFPPLDYEAHATKSNKDYDKGIRFLQIAGITAAIAGGLFIPPVALAAPLIAASIGSSTPKAVSEIPVKGGVKTDGSNFTRSLTLSNQGKEGIYYVTVWATPSMGEESVAVSRRAIIARKEHSSNNSGNEKEEQHSDEEKKDGDGKQAQPGAL